MLSKLWDSDAYANYKLTVQTPTQLQPEQTKGQNNKTVCVSAPQRPSLCGHSHKEHCKIYHDALLLCGTDSEGDLSVCRIMLSVERRAWPLGNTGPQDSCDRLTAQASFIFGSDQHEREYVVRSTCQHSGVLKDPLPPVLPVVLIFNFIHGVNLIQSDSF